MSETTDQFMERFKATGLHMLTEARRREEQLLAPFNIGWVRSIGRRWTAPYPNLQQIPKDEVWDQPHKPFRDLFLDHWLHRPEPRWQFVDFDTNAPLAEMTVTGRALDPDRRVLETALAQQRSIIVTKARSCGLSYHRQALAAALMVHGLSNTTFEEFMGIAADVHLWGSAMMHMHEPIKWTEPRKPPAVSLGPGKEVETPGERRVNPKRIAKDRLKKKLAKKSRK